MKWKPKTGDDFTAKEGDYMLRVEQMDKKIWWWEVYYQNEPIMGHCHYQPETEEQAKAFSEMVYLAHKMALTQTKQ